MEAEVTDHKRQTAEISWVKAAGKLVRQRQDDREAIVALLARRLLSNETMMPSERVLRAQLLGAAGQEAAVEPLLEALILDNSPVMHLAVAQALIAIGRPAGERLLARCESLDPTRQAFVLTILREIMHSLAEHQPAFLWLCDCVANEILALALADGASEAVCIRAGEVLGYFGLDAESLKMLEQSAREPALVQRIMLAALSYPGPEEGLDAEPAGPENLALQREAFIALIKRVLAIRGYPSIALDPPEFIAGTDWRTWCRQSWQIAHRNPPHSDLGEQPLQNDPSEQPPKPGQPLIFTRVGG